MCLNSEAEWSVIAEWAILDPPHPHRSPLSCLTVPGYYGMVGVGGYHGGLSILCCLVIRIHPYQSHHAAGQHTICAVTCTVWTVFAASDSCEVSISEVWSKSLRWHSGFCSTFYIFRCNKIPRVKSRFNLKWMAKCNIKKRHKKSVRPSHRFELHFSPNEKSFLKYLKNLLICHLNILKYSDIIYWLYAV